MWQGKIKKYIAGIIILTLISGFIPVDITFMGIDYSNTTTARADTIPIETSTDIYWDTGGLIYPSGYDFGTGIGAENFVGYYQGFDEMSALKFELKSIPLGYTITSAKLVIHITSVTSGSGGEPLLNLLGINDNTWNTTTLPTYLETESILSETIISTGVKAYDVTDYINKQFMIDGNASFVLTGKNSSSFDPGDIVEFGFAHSQNYNGTYTKPHLEISYALPLTQVTGVTLSDTGIVTWDNAIENNGYVVNLYHETTLIHTETVGSGTVTCNILSAMRSAGAGTYHVTVIAKGDGNNYVDGPESEASENRTVIQLGLVDGLVWMDNVAHWAPVEHALEYVVYLYRDLEFVTAKNISAANVAEGADFTVETSYMGGEYYYNVTAMGDDNLILNAGYSSYSPMLIKYIQLGQVTGVALSADGIVTWEDVDYENQYIIQLYKDGNVLGSPIYKGADILSHDFLSTMRSEGIGEYTVTVTAEGSGFYVDGITSEPSIGQSVLKLSTVEGLNWLNNTAHWTGVIGAVSYKVALYKDGSPTPVAQQNILVKDLDLGADFSDEIANGGSFTFIVTAMGDDALIFNGEPSVESALLFIAPKLDTVTDVVLNSSGVVSWVDVQNETNYSILLYKNGTPINPTVITAANVTSYDLLSAMRAGGAGTYTVTVTAKSNIPEYIDGNESLVSMAQEVIKLDKVSGLHWIGNEAHYTPVANGVSYDIQLYTNDNPVSGAFVNILGSGSSTKDFTNEMVIGGSFTFQVTARGNDTLILDGEESEASPVNIKAIQLENVANVTLSSSGIAAWSDVENENNYLLQLYKNGSAFGSPVIKNADDLSHDFLTVMRSEGVGTYTVSVKAVGDGIFYLDSLISQYTNGQIIKKLATVMGGINWNGNVAQWMAVEDAVTYEVQLYKNSITLNLPVIVLAENAQKGVDFEQVIKKEGAGTYTYIVTAKGDGIRLLDADQSIVSENLMIQLTSTPAPTNTPTPTPTNVPINTPTPITTTPVGSTKENREVPFLVGTGETEAGTIPIIRTINSNGWIKDSFELETTKVKQVVINALKINSSIVTIQVADSSENSADEVEILLHKGASQIFGESNITLNIQTNKVNLEFPAKTAEALKDSNGSIRITEVKEEKELENTKSVLLKLAAGAIILNAPISIETNFSQMTQITLPIKSSHLPTDQNKMGEFVASLSVLVEHSDGETRLLKGTIQYDEAGKPVGLSIWVDKFSTFTLVKSSFVGTNKILSKKQMPDKVCVVNFSETIDPKTVTEDSVYVLDANGSKVDVKLQCSGKTIRATPVNMYELKETYTLYFTKNVFYKSGKSIEKARKYVFTIGKISLDGNKMKEYTQIATNKVWSINLKADIDTDKINSKNVMITDEYCNVIKAEVSVAKGSFLKVTTKKPYEKGKIYYLIVKEVIFEDKTSMNEDIWIKFTIK